MTNIGKKKLWKYLFWLGPFLIAAGLTAGLVSENWGAIPLALIISGIAIVGLWLVWQSQESNWWGRRSTQVGTNALVATLAVLAILGLINFLGTRYHLRTDLTETQLFTLAPQSRELVRSLLLPVKVWVFDVNQDALDQDLLENYRRQSSKFEFEYVDPQARPALVSKFGVKNPGEVYLESGDRRELVQVVSPQQRLSEVRLTNRLQQITTSSTPKVYFLQGHGEKQLSVGENTMLQAVQALGDKSYASSDLNLIQNSSVPQDAAVVVVAGPKRALFESEVKALRDYLNRGGNLLLMIDPNSDPKLDSLLVEWGVKLDNRLVIDVSGNQVGVGPAVSFVTQYGQHPITKDFGNNFSFYPIARAVETTPVAGVEATELLLTKSYPDSWAESDQKSENLQFNPESDRKGPLALGVALVRKLPAKSEALSNPTNSASPTPTPTASPTTARKASPTNSASPTPTPTASPTTARKASPTNSASPTPSFPPKSPTATQSSSNQSATESRIVVIGNSDFVTDGLFEQQLNGDVFLNSVTWLSQQDQQPLSISPKEAKNRRINLTTAQANLLALSSLLVLPLIGLAVAAVLWWQRR